MCVKRTLGSAAGGIEFAVRGPKPALGHTVVGVAVVAVERHQLPRGVALSDHNEHVEVSSLIRAHPYRQGHAAGDLGVFGESVAETYAISAPSPWGGRV